MAENIETQLRGVGDAIVKAEKEWSRLLDHRDELIRVLAAGGHSHSSISKWARITRPRVSQILKADLKHDCPTCGLPCPSPEGHYSCSVAP